MATHYLYGFALGVLACAVACSDAAEPDERSPLDVEGSWVPEVRASVPATREILAAYRTAAGDTFPSRIRTLRFRYQNVDAAAREITEVWFAAPHSYQKVLTRQGQPPIVFTVAGGDAWLSGPVRAAGSGAAGVSPEMWVSRRSFIRDLLLTAPAALADAGVVRFVPRGTVRLGGQDAQRLAVTGTVSSIDELYMDARSGLPAALVMRVGAIMPGDPERHRLVRIREFTDVDGLSVPTVITHEWLNEGRIIATIYLDGYHINEPIDQFRFRRPDASDRRSPTNGDQ